METQTASTASLIPYERNNRQHSQQQVDRIANSIAEFGFNQPIVVDENNIVLVGHGRLEAAKKLGLPEVPVLVKAGLTETQKKAYRILDNKLQNDSTWDAESLNLELAALADADFDLAAWGLDEFAKLFPEDKTVEEDDFEPREVKETIIKLGDVLELGDHRLLCGDATKAEDVRRLMNGERARLMNTDPPYGVGYANDERPNPGVAKPRVANDDLTDENLQFFLELAFRAAVDFALVPDAAWYMWHAHLTQGYFAAAAAAAAANVILHRQIIWVKPVLLLGRGQYHWKHEPCFMGWVKGNQPPDYGEGGGERTQTTVWEIESVSHAERKNFNHATPKPIGLFAIPLIKHTRTGEIAFEPFSGSGPQLIAADQLGRRCYGMEISPQYCQVIVDRYKAHCEKSGKPFECRLNGDDVSGYISKPDHVADADSMIA